MRALKLAHNLGQPCAIFVLYTVTISIWRSRGPNQILRAWTGSAGELHNLIYSWIGEQGSTQPVSQLTLHDQCITPRAARGTILGAPGQPGPDVRLTRPRAGASSDGGFIGHDEIVFMSAVLAHAPGLYSLIRPPRAPQLGCLCARRSSHPVNRFCMARFHITCERGRRTALSDGPGRGQ